MAKAGLDELPVYRGIIKEKAGPGGVAQHPAEGATSQGTVAEFDQLPTFEHQQNGAQSFTTLPSVANTWGGVGSSPKDGIRVVIRRQHPRRRCSRLPVLRCERAERRRSRCPGHTLA